MPDRAEFVYLIGSEAGTLVKIGRSNDVSRRLADIQLMSPAKLTVLWRTEGGKDLETALHHWFKMFRSHGEWFDFPAGDAVERVKRAIVTVKKARKAERVYLANGRRKRPVHPTSRIGMQYIEARRPKPPPERGRFTVERAPAVYRQVADAIRGEIESGVYPSGSRLPPASELARHLGVNPCSVPQALVLLRQDGLIRSRGRAGSTVIYGGEADPPLPETG